MNTIDVYEASRSGAQWQGSVPLAQLTRLGASLVPDPAGRATALHYACHSGPDALGRPALQLRLEGVLPLRCDRCGEVLHFTLAAASVFYFVDTEEQLAAVPIDDTPEEALLGSTHFDLAELIEDEAILQLPISPRHGRCPAGALAGRGAAAQGTAAQRPHPFAGLAGLKDGLAARPDGCAESGAPIDTAAGSKKRSGRA